jgi:hypothetical protein
VNEIAACPRLADPLDGDYRFEKSLARLAVAALVRTGDMAARCRNQGEPGSSVPDISFPNGEVFLRFGFFAATESICTHLSGYFARARNEPASSNSI